MNTPLDWILDTHDGILKAEHPVYHDDGRPLYYIVREYGNHWEASFEGATVTFGPLSEVLAEVHKDAYSFTGMAVARQHTPGA